MFDCIKVVRKVFTKCPKVLDTPLPTILKAYTENWKF